MALQTCDRNGGHSLAAKARLQADLRRAVVLEAKIGDEVERLLSLAFEQGWTDDDICAASGFTPEDVADFRRRAGKRLKTIFCKGCDLPVPRSGRRGQPRQWCTRCKP